jgi:hypothetical protein
MQVFDSTIKETLTKRLLALEAHFDADVVFLYGEIRPLSQSRSGTSSRSFVKSTSPKKLVVFLSKPGGSAETDEKMVERAFGNGDRIDDQSLGGCREAPFDVDAQPRGGVPAPRGPRADRPARGLPQIAKAPKILGQVNHIDT